MDRDLDHYLRAVFAAVGDRTVGFHSATSNVVQTHSATLCQDVPSSLTHVDGRLVALAFEPLATTSFDPLGPGKAPPPL